MCPLLFSLPNLRPQRTSTPNDDDHFLLTLYVCTPPVLSKGEPFPGGEEQPYLFRCWLPSAPPAEFLSVGRASHVLWMNKSVMNECPQLGTAHCPQWDEAGHGPTLHVDFLTDSQQSCISPAHHSGTWRRLSPRGDAPSSLPCNTLGSL